VIEVPPARKGACAAALASLRPARPPPGADPYKVDLPVLVRHFAWLAETVRLSVVRFVGSGGDSRRTALAGHAEQHPRVWDSLRAWLDVADPDDTAGPWYAADGALAVDQAALASRLAGSGDEGRAGAAVREALAPYRLGRQVRPRLADGARPRCAALDGAGLADGVGLDPDEREALLGRLAASKGRGLFRPGPDPRRPGGG
jgi:hypothetical protein